MFKFFRRRPSTVPFERQISALASCGIKLAPGVAPESLLGSFDRATFEADPYRLLLTCMGNEAEVESQAGESAYPSDNVWHLDTECIEGHGAYVAIARRLKDLAQGELPLEDISDHVDVEAREAHVAFRLRGQPYRWDAEVADDYVDPSILSRFAELLRRTSAQRRFTYVDLGGQDCLIGCATSHERERLEAETGIKVEWLK